MFADIFEELEVGDMPLTRWTYLVAGGPELPRLLKPIANRENNKYVGDCCDNFASKFDRDQSEDFHIAVLEDENAKKLNIASTL